ncbi:MAG TPA: 5-formyltetrahydrofolate cyclo-ligase [Geminicoccaceae bacterium]|nr:5-formyltetrahydrofolate cyclo-ligase [Geminicoccaceae bacterium]
MSTLEHLVQRKAALRAEQRRRRQAVAAQSGRAGEAVAERLIEAFPLPSAAVVSGYWPLEDELDPRPCMTRLAAQGHPLALPRVQGRGRPLAFHAWRPGDPLLAGPFGVMEPDPDAPAVRPRVLLVPLLAFDRQGRRLGYGAGYYDLALRELRALSPLPLAIGVAFAAQEVDEVPTGPRDQPLDAVVTERAVHRCSGPGGAGSAAAALETGRA